MFSCRSRASLYSVAPDSSRRSYLATPLQVHICASVYTTTHGGRGGGSYRESAGIRCISGGSRSLSGCWMQSARLGPDLVTACFSRASPNIRSDAAAASLRVARLTLHRDIPPGSQLRPGGNTKDVQEKTVRRCELSSRGQR